MPETVTSYHVVTKGPNQPPTRIDNVIAIMVDDNDTLWMHDREGRPIFFAHMQGILYVKDVGPRSMTSAEAARIGDIHAKVHVSDVSHGLYRPA